MTVYADVGTPDWLTPTPGSTRVMADETIALGSSFVDAIQIDTAAFRALSIRLLNNTAVFLVAQIEWKDQEVSAALIPARRAMLPGTGRLDWTVPCVGPTCQLSLFSADGTTNVNAQLHVSGHGASDRPDAQRGAIVIYSADGVAVGAGATLTATPTEIVEGPAVVSASLFGGEANWTFDVTAVDYGGVTQRLYQTSGNAAVPLTTAFQHLYLPPYPVTLKLRNATAAAHNAYISLVAGG